MAKKISVSIVIFLSLMVSEVFTLDCYTCTGEDVSTCVVMNCEQHFSQLGPNYVCRKVVTTSYNVTIIDKGCGRSDFCDRMREENLPHDTCDICTRNRCNSSVTLEGNITVVFLMAFLSLIIVAK